jgi:hypothetical protein
MIALLKSLCLFCALFVSGCATDLDVLPGSEEKNPLISSNYAAADRLLTAAVKQELVSKVSHVASYQPGTLTLLGSGLLVLREIALYNSSAWLNAGGTLAAITADVVMTRQSTPPDLELILSVSVQKEGQYLATSNQVYYLFSQDLNMYQNLPPTGRIFPVNGPGESK